MMHYGLYLPNYGVFGDVRRLAALAHEAEAAGWEGFFLWDHIAARDEATGAALPVVDPWVALTAVTLATETLRIGTTVTPLPRRRPWKLARETATLDQLSGGRLILGVGIGLGTSEWGDLGEEADLRVRGQMLDEGLDVLTGLWSGQPFTYDGSHYNIQQAQFSPTPVQTPRIPIWVGGFWPNQAPFRRMARWDGMFPLFDVYGPPQLPLFAEAVQSVQAMRVDADQPFDVIKLGVTSSDRPDEAAYFVRSAMNAGATWWLEVLMPEVHGLSSAQDGAFEVLQARVLQGPPKP